MDPNEIQEVRKIIESSTSKVSLRDLERKGFRKVKVLRSNDIDELIRRAVTSVVARESTADNRVSEEIIERSRQELKQLMAAAQAAERERAEILERNAVLEGEVRDLRARAEASREHEATAAHAGQKLEEVSRRLAEREREAADLRRRVEDAEARALMNQARAAEAVESQSKLSALRDEVDTLRSRLKQVETERRLIEELEVPKLRERLEEAEAELRVSRAAARAAPAAGVDDERMRAMFRDILREVGAGAGGGVDGSALKTEFAKLQNAIAESIARAGGRGAQITEADLDAARVSLDALFKHETAPAVESNINEVKVKEKTTTSDLKSKMDKLKALRKGGSSE